jgi:hypothetical protein
MSATAKRMFAAPKRRRLVSITGAAKKSCRKTRYSLVDSSVEPAPEVPFPATLAFVGLACELAVQQHHDRRHEHGDDADFEQRVFPSLG